ncbi:hypothetical protein MHBO_001376 [Bonamia ostreae]|uniref:Uncharacterized protein n=1 Tax=Bonamia ostreae TaxID=126728 RepID=A0ABV2AJZ3_9EUKA
MRTQSIDSENKRSSSLESPEIIPGEKIAETAKFLNQNSLTKITEKSIRKTNFCQQKDKSFCRRMVKPDERENTSNDNKKTDHKNNTENLLSSKQKASNTKKSDKNPLITGNFETRRNILSNFRERKNKINYLIKTVSKIFAKRILEIFQKYLQTKIIK